MNAAVFRLVLLSWLLSIGLLEQTQAGAWAQKKGRGLSITTYRFYQTGTLFGSFGSKAALPAGGVFTKHELQEYLEYGWNDRLTLLGSFYLDQLTYRDDAGRDSNLGFPNQELGARIQLFRNPVQAVEILASIPGAYSRSSTPFLGQDQYDFQVMYFVGGNYLLQDHPGYWEFGAGVRLRLEAPSDQVRWQAATGVSLHPRWDLELRLGGIHGLGNDEAEVVGNNVTLRSDFHLIQAGFSLLYKPSPRWVIAAGPFWNMLGQDTGGGGGAHLSVWKSF